MFCQNLARFYKKTGNCFSRENALIMSFWLIVDVKKNVETTSFVMKFSAEISEKGTQKSVLAGTGVSFDQSSHLLKLEKSENDFHGVLDSEFTLTYSTQDLLQFDFCPQSVEEIASSCKPTVLGPLVKALAVSRDANVEPIAMDASFQETWPGIFRRKSSSPLSESISKDVAGIINVAAVRYGCGLLSINFKFHYTCSYHSLRAFFPIRSQLAFVPSF